MLSFNTHDEYHADEDYGERLTSKRDWKCVKILGTCPFKVMNSHWSLRRPSCFAILSHTQDCISVQLFYMIQFTAVFVLVKHACELEDPFYCVIQLYLKKKRKFQFIATDLLWKRFASYCRTISQNSVLQPVCHHKVSGVARMFMINYIFAHFN